jgi:hypothetical protein
VRSKMNQTPLVSRQVFCRGAGHSSCEAHCLHTMTTRFIGLFHLTAGKTAIGMSVAPSPKKNSLRFAE